MSRVERVPTSLRTMNYPIGIEYGRSSRKQSCGRAVRQRVRLEMFLAP